MRKFNKCLLVSALFLCFAGLSFAQGTPADVPDHVMQNVIRRILVKTFRPASQPKTVEIAGDGISLSWLPLIRNIKFRLVRDSENKGSIYFFTKPELSKNTYTIGFGFGDPGCSGTGQNWSFRLVKQKVQLWQNGVFGMGCGQDGGSSDGSGQTNN